MQPHPTTVCYFLLLGSRAPTPPPPRPLLEFHETAPLSNFGSPNLYIKFSREQFSPPFALWTLTRRSHCRAFRSSFTTFYIVVRWRRRNMPKSLLLVQGRILCSSSLEAPHKIVLDMRRFRWKTEDLWKPTHNKNDVHLYPKRAGSFTLLTPLPGPKLLNGPRTGTGARKPSKLSKTLCVLKARPTTFKGMYLPSLNLLYPHSRLIYIVNPFTYKS